MLIIVEAMLGGGGGEGIWEISIPPTQFCYEAKIAQEINKVEIDRENIPVRY